MAETLNMLCPLFVSYGSWHVLQC